MKKAVETDDKFYIFMEYCNGCELKELLEGKNYNIDGNVIQ